MSPSCIGGSRPRARDAGHDATRARLHSDRCPTSRASISSGVASKRSSASRSAPRPTSRGPASSTPRRISPSGHTKQMPLSSSRSVYRPRASARSSVEPVPFSGGHPSLGRHRCRTRRAARPDLHASADRGEHEVGSLPERRAGEVVAVDDPPPVLTQQAVEPPGRAFARIAHIVERLRNRIEAADDLVDVVGDGGGRG